MKLAPKGKSASVIRLIRLLNELSVALLHVIGVSLCE